MPIYKTFKKYCKKIPKENFIIEPALRDTAPCIGFAAAIIAKKFPNEEFVMICNSATGYGDTFKEIQKKAKNIINLKFP